MNRGLQRGNDGGNVPSFKSVKLKEPIAKTTHKAKKQSGRLKIKQSPMAHGGLLLAPCFCQFLVSKPVAFHDCT